MSCLMDLRDIRDRVGLETLGDAVQWGRRRIEESHQHVDFIVVAITTGVTGAGDMRIDITPYRYPGYAARVVALCQPLPEIRCMIVYGHHDTVRGRDGLSGVLIYDSEGEL